jgi:hypothetical protein
VKQAELGHTDLVDKPEVGVIQIDCVPIEGRGREVFLTDALAGWRRKFIQVQCDTPSPAHQ